MKKIILATIALSASLGLLVGQAQATTYSFADNWVNWPGYTSGLGDTNGTPKLDHMDVTVGSDGFLDQVDIVLLGSTTRQLYDSLFINTYNLTTTNSAWDDWDYFVHDGGSANTTHTAGTVASDGLYRVQQDYDYTYVKDYNRVGNPNGIDANSLAIVDSSLANFGASQSGYVITYDFSGLTLDVSNGFFMAYAPWCDNDVMGGGTEPVPEPATMLLFGTGLVGLASLRRRYQKG